VHGQDHDPGLRDTLSDPAGHLQPAQGGHHQVEHQHIGPQAFDQLERLQAIAGLTHDAQVRLGLQQGSQSLANKVMIIGQYDCGHLCHLLFRS